MFKNEGTSDRTTPPEVKDLLEKLGGKRGQEWLEALGLFLCRKNPWPESKFSVWKTINLGTGLEITDDFRHALREGGCNIGNCTDNVLGELNLTITTTKETRVTLANVTVPELGFPNGAKWGQVLKKIQKMEGELCSLEVVLQLCLQYLDHPDKEWLLIATDPTIGSGSRLLGFAVECDGSELWLIASWVCYDDLLDPDIQIVFVLPRKEGLESLGT